MYISVETGWIKFHRTAVYSFRYFGQFLRKVVEYLTEYVCTEGCLERCENCDQRNDLVGSSSSSSSSSSSYSSSSQRRLDEDDISRGGGAAAEFEALHHRKTCLVIEIEETQCLNGGSCFAIELHNGMRRAGCSCPPTWTGERCEMRYIDPRLWADDEDYIHTAGVRFEVFLLICICVLLITSGYIYLRFQKRHQLWHCQHQKIMTSSEPEVIVDSCSKSRDIKEDDLGKRSFEMVLTGEITRSVSTAAVPMNLDDDDDDDDVDKKSPSNSSSRCSCDDNLIVMECNHVVESTEIVADVPSR